jgi:putative Mg2+ transporter-C (MgtC) family protein
MNTIWQTIRDELSDLNDWPSVIRVLLRLLVAALLGGLLGWQREQAGKSAGLRTHMLVAMGAALIVLVPQQAGMANEPLSRILQGLLAGIGFIGGGAIIHNQRQGNGDSKNSGDGGEVKGLTTAAGLWMTTAIGIAAGLGRELTAVLSTLLTLAVLALVHRHNRTHGKNY